ncbi:hypothetical protein [Sporosarcina sp. FSL W7-1283]|uniref:hypothetical protein n=1 Tax=Sporosarcina sp. FSL W7-1283 TaxID=2921560 RepID=UPI0030F96CC4
MKELKIPQISSKLNPVLDADLIEQILKIPRRDRSRTYREALRFYFNYLDKIENI